ncbi:hybrid sensor histidine kinase/response regulator [Pedobacter nutrimenti]|uniref:histidine kinase n=1 Tax=Pedobacter nutrimenti TaxID=1241337 RepID=A0A318U8F3_9SPHI|nr:ATP-binding protein [Pedobacter nutrimenti]PYF70133.1 Hpt domain-containing protein [Pedobacter nutrimenti]
MIGIPKSSFIQAIRGKVILALILACFALFMAWLTSRVAFREMLNTVEHLSSPNERLRIVNELSRKITSLDQMQRRRAFNDPGNYNAFFKESRQLRISLDSLSQLYAGDSVQLQRIRSINELLSVRDKQFVNYLKVREKLVNNKSFSSQVQKFSDMVSRNAAQADSTVVTSEKKTSTTTVIPTEEKPRGFFSKIFGKKKTETEDKAFKIVNEENVKRDTIALSNERKIVKGVEASLRAIEKEQKLKSQSFLNREAVLADANSLLISQMLGILKKVEAEAVAQIEMNGVQAKKVVNTGISRISIIMVVFFLLMVLLLYLILTDITKSNRYRKELETATEEAEYHGKAKQRFLSNMSHEIRTPLQSIIGYAELIRKQQQPGRKYVDAIYHSSEHLLQIVNEVLDYNRLVSGKFTFSEQVFNLRKLLEEVVLIVAPQATRKMLKMTQNFELDDLEYIYGDPFRLRQILLNLLSNAIKFTMEGEILLSVFYKRQGDNLHFTFMVKDTGIGLSEEESKHIFNEFEQAESPEQSVVNQNGAGLGLTIVKALVENQGGRIYVKSKKGEGSSFTFYLQFKIGEAPDLSKIQEGAVPAALGKKVWIVDDDQLILDLCSLIFSNHQMAFRCFNSPLDLLNEPWDNEVGVLLMDIRMPELSGVELCRAMRLKIGKEVKMYAMTAQVLPGERENLLAGGFDGILMKPFKERELLSIFNLEALTEEINDQIPGGLVFDPAYLQKMTFGDPQQFHKIMDRFREDCRNDKTELEQGLKQNDKEKVSLLLHRLAGRIAQIGSRELAADFRKAEIRMESQNADVQKQKDGILLLCQHLDELIHLMEDYSIS